MKNFVATISNVKIASVAIAVSIALTACGSDSPSTEAAAAETTAVAEAAAPTEAAPAEANEVDVRFSQGGLGHHSQAVELAEIALDPKAGARPEILELSKGIIAPSPEFTRVEELLTTWGKPLELSKEEMAKMDGMATPETVETLANLTGAEFDTTFLNTLVKHHEGAIKMAEKVLAEGSNTDLKPVAEKLLALRTTELVSIKALLA
jgi:uncharacterized protein (DUF305 family)